MCTSERGFDAGLDPSDAAEARTLLGLSPETSLSDEDMWRYLARIKNYPGDLSLDEIRQRAAADEERFFSGLVAQLSRKVIERQLEEVPESEGTDAEPLDPDEAAEIMRKVFPPDGVPRIPPG